MGSQATKSLAFATNYIKGFDYIYGAGCGGSGGGGCITPAAFSYIWWTIKPSQFAVRNRHLVLQDVTWLPYTDGGPALLCTHSDGVQQGFDVYLLYSIPGDHNFGAHAVSKQTISSTQTLPFFLNWDSPGLIPQQANVNWDGHIYVVVDLRTTGLMVSGSPQNNELFATTNLDFDQRV